MSEAASAEVAPDPSVGTAVDLELRELRVAYGGIAAVKGVSLAVKRGEIVALIGANGAGKTSVLKALVGLVPLATEQAHAATRQRDARPCHSPSSSRWDGGGDL